MKNILLILFLSSCSVLFKKATGIKNPVVESNTDINEYLEIVNNNFNNSFRINIKEKNDSNIIKAIFNSFQSPIILNKSFSELCYLNNEKCTGIKLINAFKNIDSTYSLCEPEINYLEKIKDLELISNQPLDTSNSDFYVVYFWSKFYTTKIKFIEDLNWLQELKNNSPENIDILLVNCDLNENWGLKRNEELKIKFKFIKNKQGGFEIGEIPYKKSQ